MPLVYLPDARALFLWGEGVPPELLDAQPRAVERSAALVTPAGRREVSGLELPLLDAVSALALAPAEAPERSATLAAWVIASKLALDLVARERVVPVIQRKDGQREACWAAALSSSEDAGHVVALGRSLPPAAHAVPALGGAELDVWAPEPLLRAFIDAVVDALLRSVRGAPGPRRGKARAAPP